MSDDVHQLRGIRLEGLKRDPSYFFLDCQMEQAHLEECFDEDTLFYDIFFDPTNRYLVAIGPPLGNLKIDLKICVNGEPIRHRVIKRAAERSYLVRGEVSQVAKRNDILVTANEQQWQLSVPENNTGTGHKFTLCTIQKDNKEHWIRDWIKHYRNIGCDRIILYDNNSERRPDVDAIVIPCPYKHSLNKYRSVYGRGIRASSCFLPRSLLTLCCYKYRSGHLLNFDIDELLQVKSLEKYKRRRLVYFNYYFVESKTDGGLPKDYSFRHFVYRNARRRHQSYKFVVRMDALLFARDPHRAILKGMSIPRTIIRKLMKIQSCLGLAGDAFYHYRGINTGWKEDRSSFDENTKVVKLENPGP